MIPVEVKAGKAGRLRSLAVFVETYRPPVAVRIYAGSSRRDGDIVSVPLYGLERLPAFLAETARVHPSGAPRRSS